MKSNLIAPCGMNCNICIGHLREKNKCNGCRDLKSNRRKCKIINCIILKENNWKFCSDKCKKFPCERLRQLDKRYKTKYDMSMINNLKLIKDKGIRKFLRQQKKKYIKDQKVLCIHNKKYYDLK